jgi:hypothetical protein
MLHGNMAKQFPLSAVASGVEHVFTAVHQKGASSCCTRQLPLSAAAKGAFHVVTVVRQKGSALLLHTAISFVCGSKMSRFTCLQLCGKKAVPLRKHRRACANICDVLRKHRRACNMP